MVHAPSRRRNKGRTRILYWFRTPPGVRVGRAPLDEDAIRLIEELHPHIKFDWPQILKGEEEMAPALPPRAYRESPAPRQNAAPEIVGPADPGPPLVDEPVSPAHARLGSEGLARLRARYAQVQAALTRRVADEARRDELKTVAERLNPDGWVTDGEVTSGLDQYEAVLASLRDVIGRRRRRKGRRPRPEAAPGGVPVSADEPPADGPPDEGSDAPDEEPGSGN